MSIQREAIFHKAQSMYCYMLETNLLSLKIRVKKDNVNKITLFYSDKYKINDIKALLMSKFLSDDLYDYWQSKVKVVNKRIAYYFHLENENESIFFTEMGSFNNLNYNSAAFFEYAYMNESDMHIIPNWIKNAIAYQIFPERFLNGKREISPKNCDPWLSTPKANNFMGGDLIGIEKKLPYLRELGINLIYLTPIFKSLSNHKYDTINYFKIDEHFGSKEDFKRLVKRAKALGIRIILDAVFNHCSINFSKFKDLIKNREKSKYKDWFYLKNNDKNKLSYETFAFTDLMPKLNLNNLSVKRYFISLTKYWIREFDIDGLRLDVADEVPHAFWRELRSEINTLKNNFYIVGETWHDGEPWLRGEQFDGIMNYSLKEICQEFFALESLKPQDFKNSLSKILMRNTMHANFAMLNLLNSHDTPRFINICNFNRENWKLAYLFLFSFIGVPMIYYGDEIGISGEGDPLCRACMNWNEREWDRETLKFTKQIIKLRNEKRALREGEFMWREINKELLSFERTISYKNKREKILIILNNNEYKVKYELKKEKNLNYFKLFSLKESKEGLIDKKDAILFKII